MYENLEDITDQTLDYPTLEMRDTFPTVFYVMADRGKSPVF
jgi:hypothetical protein